VPALREAIAEHRQRDYGLSYDPASEILVTVGATEAISAAVLGLCDPGDEVVVFEPYYDSYAATIALAGATRAVVPLRPDVSGRFGFDLDELRRAITPRTRLMLLNSPHNPTGTVLNREELEAIAAICVERDLTVVTDEVYEHLTYDGTEHIPIATFPGMRERCVAISSAGKSFSVTGWKIGWVCAPPQLLRSVNTVKQFLTYTHNPSMQHAVADALRHEMAWVRALRDSLQERRDQLAEGLERVGMRVTRPKGTYFIQADVRPLGTSDGEKLARELPHRAGVVGIPTAAFCDSPDVGGPFVRFAFCKRPEVIDEAVQRLANVAAKVAPSS
jgi:N-succinyldiaminopimelate aminotransferase